MEEDTPERRALHIALLCFVTLFTLLDLLSLRGASTRKGPGIEARSGMTAPRPAALQPKPARPAPCIALEETKGRDLHASAARSSGITREAARYPAPEPARRKRLRLEEEEAVMEGLHYRRYVFAPDEGGESRVHVLVWEAEGSGGGHVELSLGRDRIPGRERVSSMAERKGAVAAVNASFFASNGKPLGLLVQDGELYSLPIKRRSALGIFPGGRFMVGNPTFSGSIRTRAGTMAIDGVNQHAVGDSCIVFTPRFGLTTGTRREGLEVAVVDSHVVAMQSRDTPIPPQGLVVSCPASAARILGEPGYWDEIRVGFGLTPPWKECAAAVGGGPRLLEDSAPAVNWREEGFTRSFACTPAPRTAAGIDRSGRKLTLVVVDGRCRGWSRGVTLRELALIMADLGCSDAVNLDGGGSSVMWIRGRIVNRPSDGVERAVGAALLIVPGPRTAAGGGVLASGPALAPGGAGIDTAEEGGV